MTAPVGDDGTLQHAARADRRTLDDHGRPPSSPEGKTAALTRNVTVAYKGVTLVVSVKGGRAWIKVWVDGKIDPGVGAAGQVISNGKTLTFTGRTIGRGPDRIVGRDLLHAERHLARDARASPACPRPGCSRHPKPPEKTQRR